MSIDDILFHLGESHEEWYGSIAPPIYQTSNFKLQSTADFKMKIQDDFNHHMYTRGNNPTVKILREKLAALEGTEEALVLGSGAAAMSMALLSQLRAGDHMVCVQNPYIWTKKTINIFLARYDIHCTYVSSTDTAAIQAACTSSTKVIFLESPNSLTFELQDLRAIATFARAQGIVTMIDNSYATPIYQRPAALGIDLVLHSATKYLNGHGDVMAGVICGSYAMIRKIYEEDYMILGALISPYEAALILRGLRTLPLRMQRSHESAMYITNKLTDHPRIESIMYPFHEQHPQRALAMEQMSGCGGLFSIKLRADTPEVCERFADALQHFHMAASWGGYESLQLPMCVFNDYLGGPANGAPPFQIVRLYIGLEDPEYLLQDILQALDKM